MAIQMNIADAKAKLSALVEAAVRGEDVVLAKGGKPVARIVPVAAARIRPHLLAQLGYGDVAYEAFAPEPDVAVAVDAPLGGED